MKTKKVLLVMPHMIGGGAERVGAQLMNSFADRGFETEIMLTADRTENVIRSDLDERTVLTLIPEILPSVSVVDNIRFGILLKLYAQIFCNIFELFRLPVPAQFAKASLFVQYHREIALLRKKLLEEPDTAVIAFLQPAVPIVLLAARGLPNRVIFSERGNPQRLMKKRYGRKFIEKYYLRADAAVFQTQDAESVYPEAVAAKGVVIENPLKAGLPAPYHGVREKRVVTFCRISPEKNLSLLIESFALFHQKNPDYSLRIFGDPANEEGEREAARAKKLISDKGLENAVRIMPFRPDVHEEILRDMMYVNSSDSEGLSNAMLESMAIGLPCICTDCPAGGARATICSGENGILVPVGDAGRMCSAMCGIAEDEALRNSLSRNAAGVRDRLSLDAVADRWVELL